MNPKQAMKIVNGYFWEAMKDLNFDANLYDRGIIRNDRTKNASEHRKKAHEAINTLHQFVEGKKD